jgi:hypothetical protein
VPTERTETLALGSRWCQREPRTNRSREKNGRRRNRLSAQGQDVTRQDRYMLTSAGQGATTARKRMDSCQPASVERIHEISANKSIIVVRVPVLHGRKGGLSSRKDLARKSANITGIITVGPLKPVQKRETNKRRHIYQAIETSTVPGTAFCFG